MGKTKRQPPQWWSEYKKQILTESRQASLEKQQKYEQKSAELQKPRDSWDSYQKKQMNIELARLFQNTRSASQLMRRNQDRTEMILTFTISQPFRVADTDKSFDTVMQRIMTQANSLIYHMRTLSKSTVLTSDELKECAYKKRFHYHWAMELQTSGDVHMHTVVSIYDDIEELARLIELVHKTRNTYLDVHFSKRDCKHGVEILPLGRTHFALSAHLKDGLMKHYRAKGIYVQVMQDKENSKRLNYFLPSLSPQIDVYSGKATLLEFNDNKTMAKKYDSIRKYILSMTRAKFKLRTAQTAISNAQRVHNLKGKFEGDETKAAEDIAVFEYLGIKLHSSSQMLFSKDFYQKIRKQLMEYKSRYKSLAEVTIDWCKGDLVVEGKSPNRIVYSRGEAIAIEPKEKKVAFDNSCMEERNEYAVAKGGM
ncbi:hypothetical protein [Sulfurimonas sp. NW9]|uniref:hypothetical protein n=1 Tax=Sulfurimonas sp. NW9 TaxID=2922728 RepID=UPI003DAA294D